MSAKTSTHHTDWAEDATPRIRFGEHDALVANADRLAEACGCDLAIRYEKASRTPLRLPEHLLWPVASGHPRCEWAYAGRGATSADGVRATGYDADPELLRAWVEAMPDRRGPSGAGLSLSDLVDHRRVLASRDGRVRINVVSPYAWHDDDPGFDEAGRALLLDLAELVRRLSPAYLDMYGLFCLPPAESLYWPGDTPTFGVCTYRPKGGERRAFVPDLAGAGSKGQTLLLDHAWEGEATPVADYLALSRLGREVPEETLRAAARSTCPLRLGRDAPEGPTIPVGHDEGSIA